MLITANGLITRSYASGDHDRIVHLLTEEHGRLAVMVKGGRAGKGKDHTASCTQPFTYGNYELYRGKGGDLYWYRSGSVLGHFFDVTQDLSRTALAAYLCDVATELTDENSPVPETASLLRMLLNALYVLSNGDKPCAIIKGVFELRAAALMGYQPDLTGCAHCGEGYPDQAYFDIMNGRLICADCQSARNRQHPRLVEMQERDLGERRILCPLSSSVLAAMRYALTAPERKIFSFALKDREEEYAFDRAAETFLLNQLEQDFETLRFYRSVVD